MAALTSSSGSTGPAIWRWVVDQRERIQTEIFKVDPHFPNIYSAALPAWWSVANHGIGVGGHWGRIERARSECWRGVVPFSEWFSFYKTSWRKHTQALEILDDTAYKTCVKCCFLLLKIVGLCQVNFFLGGHWACGVSRCSTTSLDNLTLSSCSGTCWNVHVVLVFSPIVLV